MLGCIVALFALESCPLCGYPVKREEPLMIFFGGGGLGQKRKKNSTDTRVGKNSTQQPWSKKKNSTVGWTGEKNANSLPEAPPDH